MNNYLLIAIADLLYAVQFLFTKLYQPEQKDKLAASLNFSLGSSFVIGLLALCIEGFRVEITAFSLVMALIMAVITVSLAYFSIASLAYVNLSLYSVFVMLGGMVMPFLYGVVFLDEALTLGKVACVVLIIVSMFLSIQKSASQKGAAKYYIAVFLINGVFAISGKVHQIYPDINTSTANVLFLTSALVVLLCALIILLRAGKQGFQPLQKPRNWLHMGGSGLSNGLAEFLSMTAMITLPASIQFSLVSGGVIMFSTLISIMRGEQQTLRTVLSILFALAALIVVGL